MEVAPPGGAMTFVLARPAFPWPSADMIPGAVLLTGFCCVELCCALLTGFSAVFVCLGGPCSCGPANTDDWFRLAWHLFTVWLGAGSAAPNMLIFVCPPGGAITLEAKRKTIRKHFHLVFEKKNCTKALFSGIIGFHLWFRAENYNYSFTAIFENKPFLTKFN